MRNVERGQLGGSVLNIKDKSRKEKGNLNGERRRLVKVGKIARALEKASIGFSFSGAHETSARYRRGDGAESARNQSVSWEHGGPAR